MSQLVFHCPPVCPAFSLRPTFKNSSKGRTPAPVLPQVLLTFISLFLPPLLPSPPSVSGGGGGGPTCGDASILPLTSARLSTCAGEVLPQRTSHPSVPPPLRPSPPFFSSLLFFLSLCFVFSLQLHGRILKLFRILREKNISNLRSEAVSG